MEHLLDFSITKVYEAKNKEKQPIEGVGEFGAWKLYNFYTNKTGKEKFSFMWDEKKPKVTEGLEVKHMEYESETKGQYTNLNVKKLEVPEGTQPEAIPNAKEDMGSIPKANAEPTVDRSVSMYVAYAKDIAIALLSISHVTPEEYESTLNRIISQVAKAGVKLMNESLNNAPESPQVSEAAPHSSKPEEGKPSPSGAKKDKLTEAFLRSVEDIQTALVMSLGESEAAKAVDSALNRYEAKSFEDITKTEHGAFIAHLASFQDKG